MTHPYEPYSSRLILDICITENNCEHTCSGCVPECIEIVVVVVVVVVVEAVVARAVHNDKVAKILSDIRK